MPNDLNSTAFWKPRWPELALTNKELNHNDLSDLLQDLLEQKYVIQDLVDHIANLNWSTIWRTSKNLQISTYIQKAIIKWINLNMNLNMKL